MTPEEVYQQALPSVFVLGSVEQLPEHPGQWQEGRLATAWALTEDGVMATNFHVFDKMTTECFGVANSKGEVFPVIDALGGDPTADIAVIRVAGKGFMPLPLAADENGGGVGRHLQPSRRPVLHLHPGPRQPIHEERADGKRQQWMSITADFAYGSSGAPVLNRFGAVVGMAAVTTNIDYPAEESSPRRPEGQGKSVAEAAGKAGEKPLRKTAERVASMTAAKVPISRRASRPSPRWCRWLSRWPCRGRRSKSSARPGLRPSRPRRSSNSPLPLVGEGPWVRGPVRLPLPFYLT